MRAAIYREFRGEISVEDLPDPVAPPGGVLLRVNANGVCRSDWHGWVGHDPDIHLPHVPGHEIAGTVVEVGEGVRCWSVGSRVSVPFIAGCGRCLPCRSGNQQVCDHQFQPGFHGWGGFAELVALHHADLNLVALPDEIDFVTAASLGCRFATAFRGVTAQGRLTAGEWLAVHGCGGVGLSAVMLGRAQGAAVIAVDIRPDVLEVARELGASAVVDASEVDDVAGAIMELTDGGAHCSVDALGHADTCFNSIACLRKRGRHVQIGLMTGDDRHPRVPMDLVIARELEVRGSHGMQAHEYARMFRLIRSGDVDPARLITDRVSLERGVEILREMDGYNQVGVAVIEP